MTLTNTNPPAGEVESQAAVLSWAIEKKADATVSFAVDGKWVNLRTTFVQYDSEQGILQLAVAPVEGQETVPHLPSAGEQVGVSFRRGHKKCLFVSMLMMVQNVADAVGSKVTLVVRVPQNVRSLQRRAYQRVIVPDHVFIAAKIWEGGVPVQGSIAWPICSGRLSNISMGGALIDTRVDQNPRLSSGEIVGVEITARPGVSLVLDGMFRHCVTDGKLRLGLGFHFPAIEHELPGRSTISELSDFVNRVRAMQH